MAKYDLIIVLGSQPSPINWQFPPQIYDCLDRAKEMLKKEQANRIAVCGKWSISIEAAGITQPFRECDAMADYLVSRGVPENKIIKEGESKDAISNLYYLKIHYLLSHKLKRLIFIAVDYRIPRLRFLCDQILGNDYVVDFEPVAGSQINSTYNEPHTTKVQKEFLKPMKPGDHAWLADKFYSAPVYEFWMKYDNLHFSEMNVSS